jgi:valine dehydrogenase (NAD+)
MTNVFASNPHGSAPTYPQGTPTSSATARSGHEQVVFCQDTQTGLRAIIAIYSTALGPSLGGTRFFPYESEDAALSDVLNLSRAMAYKNALADLDLGGGKAVRRALHHRMRHRHPQ